MGEFLQHEAHDACGSSDALARYDDGSAYCWSCGEYEHADPGKPVDPARASSKGTAPMLQGGEVVAHHTRGISEETCKKFGYKVGQDENGAWVHIAPLHDSEGRLVAQKLRYVDPKDFRPRGDLKAAGLFGQRLWRGESKRIVITEGEIDCLSYAQATGSRWPVVSVVKGSKGAAGEIAKQLEWLDTFEQVVFLFDQDEPGIDAATECAQLFAPGKARIATIPLKDPNDMLMAGQGGALEKAVFEAKPYRPDGLVRADDLWEQIESEPPRGLPYPWAGLERALRGMREGEIVTLAAGESVGKTTVTRELIANLLAQGETVGVLSFEDTPRTVVLGQLGIVMDRPLNQAATYDTVPKPELKVQFDAFPTDRLWIYCDELESDQLASRIRYMVHAGGCRSIILDHITALVAGQGTDQEWERIDRVMAKVRPLVRELHIRFVVVSHLKKNEKSDSTEGGRVRMSDLRGAALQRDSHIIVALERDLQGEEQSNQTVVRLLKNRPIGITGRATCLVYSQETGRLTETDLPPATKKGGKKGFQKRTDHSTTTQQPREDF